VSRVAASARVSGSIASSWLRQDIVAGLVMTTMLVPVGIPHAEASGIPGINGLCAGERLSGGGIVADDDVDGVERPERTGFGVGYFRPQRLAHAHLLVQRRADHHLVARRERGGVIEGEPPCCWQSALLEPTHPTSNPLWPLALSKA
jgi:hypothetical protein